jgi:hypothetical protein
MFHFVLWIVNWELIGRCWLNFLHIFTALCHITYCKWGTVFGFPLLVVFRRQLLYKEGSYNFCVSGMFICMKFLFIFSFVIQYGQTLLLLCNFVETFWAFHEVTNFRASHLLDETFPVTQNKLRLPLDLKFSSDRDKYFHHYSSESMLYSVSPVLNIFLIMLSLGATESTLMVLHSQKLFLLCPCLCGGRPKRLL